MPKLKLMRARARRFTGTLFSLWFALYVGAPQLVHPCPAHSAVAPSQATQVDHAAHHGDHSAPQQRGEDRDDSCCCPGPQCGASALVATATPAVPGAVARPTRESTARNDTLTPRVRAAHVLPCSTAPPASVA